MVKKALAYLGRMQPPTKAHVNIVKQLVLDNPDKKVFVFLVEAKSVSEENPLNFEIRKELLLKSLGSLSDKIVINKSATGFLGGLFETVENSGYTPIAVACGTDRIGTYQDTLKRINKENEVEIIEIKRNETAEDNVSATKLRIALLHNDFDSFTNMTVNYDEADFIMLQKLLINHSLKIHDIKLYNSLEKDITKITKSMELKKTKLNTAKNDKETLKIQSELNLLVYDLFTKKNEQANLEI